MKTCAIFIAALVSVALLTGCPSNQQKRTVNGSTPPPKADGIEAIAVDLSSRKEVELPTKITEKIVLNGDVDGSLGSVQALYLHGSNLYIEHREKLSVFDRAGTFNGNISSKGRADNEYLSLWCSWMDPNSLYMYDLNGEKIIQYAFADKSAKIINLPKDSKRFQALVPLAGRGFIGKLGFMGRPKNDPELAFYNNDYEFVEEISSLTLDSGIWMGFPLSRYGNEVLYWRSFEREIYSIDSNLNFGIKYRIDFGDKNIPERDFVDEYEIIDFVNKTPEKYACLLSDVVETDDHVCFTFLTNKVKNLAVFSKKSQKTAVYNFSFGEGEVLNTVVPLEDKIAVITDRESANSIIYLLDVGDLI